MNTKLFLIVPCYNESFVVSMCADSLLNVLNDLITKNKISDESRVLFIDDGSCDNTWNIIKSLAARDKHFMGMQQSRNRGHQSSILAGLMEVKDIADVTISIDCDGQDDVSAIEEMIDAYHSGNQVVYGVRSKRTTDTFFKRFTAEMFYKLLKIMGVDVVFNHADFRLLSSSVLKELQNFKEVNLFLRGLVPLVGFKSTIVYYERHQRVGGKSHYPLSKMISLAIDGITSLSVKPIRFITCIGIVIAILSFCAVLWSIVQYFMGHTVVGWASMTSVICFLGGIQLISIGVLGEYIGKIYLEVKGRPRYIISDRTYDEIGE